jgi:RNA polymerase sigma factor FliA
MSGVSDREDSAAQEMRQGPVDESVLWYDFKMQGSATARAKLFAHYAGFARTVARRHHRQRSWGDLELTDLYQSSYTGLLEALERYDPSLGAPFRPFAIHRISGSIRDGIARASEMREQLSWRARVRRERLASLADKPADASATPLERLAELAMGLALGFMLEGTGLYAEGIPEPAIDTGTAYNSVAWKDTLAGLHRELSTLPEREQTILREHYLNGMGFDELAALLALSKGRVSQLHRAALLMLRKRLRKSRTDWPET